MSGNQLRSNLFCYKNTDFSTFFQKLSPDLHKNPTKGGVNKYKQFWSEVHPATVLQIYDSYLLDFHMFGYNFLEYFQDLGIEIELK